MKRPLSPLSMVIGVCLFLSLMIFCNMTIVSSVQAEPVLILNPKVQVDRSSGTSQQGGIATDGYGKVYALYQDFRIHGYDQFFNRSTDFGLTFEATDQQVGGIGNPTWAVYPSIAADSNDHVYAVWEDLRSGMHVYLNRSIDGGVTFEGEKRINNSSSDGYPDVAADDSGHVYVSRHGGDGSGTIWVDVSNDYGETFPIHRRVNGNVSGHIAQIATDGAGNVYVTFSNPRVHSDFYLTKSSDWGNSWGAPTLIGNFGEGYSFANWSLSPNLKVEDNNVYVAWSYHAGNQEWDIYLAKSVDGGEIFGPPTLLNLPGTDRGEGLAVDGNYIYVTRQELIDGWYGDLWLIYSTDGGETFEPPVQVNTIDSKAASGRNDISARGGYIYIQWADFDEGSNPPGGHTYCTSGIIVENQPPEAICQDVAISTEPGLCMADASVDDGSFDPDGDPITLEQTPPGPYDLGDTDVTLTVTDDEGAFDTCDATVTVIDEEAPVIYSLTVNPNKLWPPNHKMVPVTVSVDSTDNCDFACGIISVASNEPVNKLDSADKAPDWIIIGDLTVKLRAERSGKGNGRVYTITVECVDSSGNSSTDTATVTVPHDKGKKNKNKKRKPRRKDLK